MCIIIVGLSVSVCASIGPVEMYKWLIYVIVHVFNKPKYSYIICEVLINSVILENTFAVNLPVFHNINI